MPQGHRSLRGLVHCYSSPYLHAPVLDSVTDIIKSRLWLNCVLI
jgi:hypothetical protein